MSGPTFHDPGLAKAHHIANIVFAIIAVLLPFAVLLLVRP